MIQGERCEHCPVSPDRPCRGQMARRLCELIDPGHADHNPAYGPALIRQAEATAYPSVATMAGNLAGAIGRAVGAAVTGKAVMVPDEVYESRLAICRDCPNFDPGPQRCRLCGCKTAAKLRGAQESCPASPPRWGRWDPASSGRPAATG